MGFIPKMDYSIDIPKSKERVLQVLREDTKSEQEVPRDKTKHFKEPFYGQIGEQSFLIGCSQYSNSMTPVIYGEIGESGSGCMVHIYMKPCNAAIAWPFICIGLVAILFAILILSVFLGSQQFSLAFLSPILVMVSFYVSFVSRFRYDAKINKQQLEKIFNPLIVSYRGVSNESFIKEI